MLTIYEHGVKIVLLVLVVLNLILCFVLAVRFLIKEGWLYIMKAMEEKIIKEGKVLPGNILKVGSFLNQQIDVDFLMEMGREVSRLFKDAGVTKVITIEASGIAVAVAVGAAMGVPAVFAKKHHTGNLSGDLYKTVVHSYTHNTDYNIVVYKDYVKSDDCFLIVDDFLANGCAIEGLIDIINQANAKVAGAAIAIEKGFQHGGDNLREQGIRVESMAIINSMEDGKIIFR